MKRSIALLVAAIVAALVPQASSSATPRATQDPNFTKELSRLSDSDVMDAFVHLKPSLADSAQKSLLRSAGLQIFDHYASVDVFHVGGPAPAYHALTSDSSVSYLEANRQLQYLGDTAPWASRARVAYEAALGGPYRDSDGSVVDGSGIGVAVVDSGIWATHPDLESRVVKNFKWYCASIALQNAATERCYGAQAYLGEVPVTDWTSGHGTHVAGIIAGDGTSSEGFFKGVAPGASLYGFGAGETLFIAEAAEAFEFIIQNHQDPSKFPVPLRIVSNSWGDSDDDGTTASPAYDPNKLIQKLTVQLVDAGLAVIYSAGNSYGSGNIDNTSSSCKVPTPGVICVANFDDLDMANRDNELDDSSSRGKIGQPTTYPDIAAPGSWILSTCTPSLPLCAAFNALSASPAWSPWYSMFSGTSMSAPHVAGAVALLLQARPDLTPAQVENLLQDSAYKFNTGGDAIGYELDPQNPADPDDPSTLEDESSPQGTTSFDKGAGLLDVRALLDLAGVESDGAPQPGAEQQIATDPADNNAAGATDILNVAVREEVDGVTYLLTLRNAADVPAGQIILGVNQNVDGVNYDTWVTLGTTGAAPFPHASSTAPATVAAIDGNLLSFFVPFSNLGDPAPDSVISNLYGYAWRGTGPAPSNPVAGASPRSRVEVAPGTVPILEPLTYTGRGGREFEPRPAYGAAATISRAVGLPQQVI